MKIYLMDIVHMSHVNPYLDQTCFDNGYLFLLPSWQHTDVAYSEVHTFQLTYLVFTAMVGFSTLATDLQQDMLESSGVVKNYVKKWTPFSFMRKS